MKSEKNLSDLYRLYEMNGISKKELEGMIFQYLLDNFERFRLFNGNRERWGDFLSWLYPRLSRAVDIYRDIGSSFDAYIGSLVHGSAREYRCRESDHSLAEYACWRAKAEEMHVYESEPEYAEKRKEVAIPEDINPRQILLLLLKSYFFVSEDFVKRVTGAIGMESRPVLDMIAELKKRRSGKEGEMLGLRERLHCQHYRCMAYQKRMQNAQKGSDYHEKMRLMFERAKKRFYTMKKRLCGMRMSASNRMIAEILGVPRGTVDSGLSAIKHRILASIKEG